MTTCGQEVRGDDIFWVQEICILLVICSKSTRKPMKSHLVLNFVWLLSGYEDTFRRRVENVGSLKCPHTWAFLGKTNPIVCLGPPLPIYASYMEDQRSIAEVLFSPKNLSLLIAFPSQGVCACSWSHQGVGFVIFSLPQNNIELMVLEPIYICLISSYKLWEAD